MLSGPAAITGQLPGRTSYNNSIDTEAYGKKFESGVVISFLLFYFRRSSLGIDFPEL